MDIEEERYATEVSPGLYIGSLRSLGQLEELHITHVLSVVNFEPAKNLTAYTALHLPLKDDESANLLAVLPKGYAFIHAALTGQQVPGDSESEDEGGLQQQPSRRPASQPLGAPGKVLVHCQAGQSRSVAVAAAYMMKAKGMTAEEALDHIRQLRPSSCPNEGFVAQLGLFQDMRCSLDTEHPVYRMWCVQQVGQQWAEEGYVDAVAFAHLPEDQEALAKAGDLYRCRKCRRLLLTQRNVLNIDEACLGHRVFRARGAKVARTGPGEGNNQQESEGSSLFVEPMAWMSDAVVGAVQGKLYCPGCSARLGSFNWSGITNERGAWITPAFQLHASRLDIVRQAGGLPASARVGRPTLLAPGPSAAAQQQHPRSNGQTATDAGQQPTSTTDGSLQGLASQQYQVSQHQVPPQKEQQQQNGQQTVPQFECLLLDCDGVLVDTEVASCESLHLAIREVTGFDIPHQFPVDYYPVFGMDVRSCIDYYRQRFSKDEGEWPPSEELAHRVTEAKERLYAQLTNTMGIRAFEGAADLIRHAQGLGLPVAVASSGAPSKIERNLVTSGLAPLISQEYVVSAAHVARGKPAPDVYVEALRRVGCQAPSRALVVEDAVNGLKAAKAAGAFAVGVTTSLPAEALSQWADVVVSDIREVLPLLNRGVQIS